MTDSLKAAFEKAKANQKDKALEAQKCLVCFNYRCTCSPGKGMTPLRPLLTDQPDAPWDCGSGV